MFLRKKTIVIASGGFDPLHVGHVRYLQAARKLGDRLFVIVNGDDFLVRKKGFAFMKAEDRQEIVQALKCVGETIPSLDTDQTVIESLKCLHEWFGRNYKLVFAKGGDRTKDNIPELGICKTLGIHVICGVGGEKIESSSELVKRITQKGDHDKDVPILSHTARD